MKPNVHNQIPECGTFAAVRPAAAGVTAVVVALLVALLASPVPATAQQEFERNWREFRLPPFEVIAEQDNNELRTFLGELFQFRHLMATMLPGDQVRTRWPIRIWVPRQSVVAGVQEPGRLPVVVDRYVVALSGKPELSPSLKAAIVRMVVSDSMRPLPEWFESGMLTMIAGARIERQVIQLGAPPPGTAPDLNWAKVNWLLTGRQSALTLAALTGNFEKGLEEPVALRNSYQITPAQLEAEAKALLAKVSGVKPEPVPTIEFSGLASNPRRDFRDWYVPLGYAELATVSALAVSPTGGSGEALSSALAGVRSRSGSFDLRARTQIQALDAFAALRAGKAEEAQKVLADLVSVGNTESAWVYLEAAKLASGRAEKQRLAAIALEKNPHWAQPHQFLASLETDAVARGRRLLEAAQLDPRNQELWEEAAAAFVEGRDYLLADRALEGAARSASNDDERQRLRDARWELREDRARKEDEDRQLRIAEERRGIEELKSKTMSRIEEALARANRANESAEIPPAEVIDFADVDDPQEAEGALVRVVCRSDESYLLEIKTIEGFTRLLLRSAESVATEGGEPWEFRCGAQQHPPLVRASFLPKVNNSLGTIGEVLSLAPQ